MKVAVHIAERTVIIDGLVVAIPAASFPTPQNINGKPADGVEVIVWDNTIPMGNIQGGGHDGGFRDPSVVKPYIDAWLEAVDTVTTGVAKAETDDETAFQKWQSQEQAADKERQRRAKLTDEQRAAEDAAAKPKASA